MFSFRSISSIIFENIFLYLKDTSAYLENKTPAKAFTPPAEKKMGTRWSFVKKLKE